eukprot:1187827-Prorocentrum_minimum.AAC.3
MDILHTPCGSARLPPTGRGGVPPGPHPLPLPATLKHPATPSTIPPATPLLGLLRPPRPPLLDDASPLVGKGEGLVLLAVRIRLQLLGRGHSCRAGLGPSTSLTYSVTRRTRADER